jgi:glutathione S-transferase
MFRQRMQDMTDEQRAVRFSNVGDPRRRDRFMSTYQDGVASPYVFHGIAAYEKAFKTMDNDLSDGRSWLMGDQFTLADINLMPLVARLYYLDLLDIWISKRPFVQDWWDRAKNRHSLIQGLTEHFKPGEVSEMKEFGLNIKTEVAARHKDYLDQFS